MSFVFANGRTHNVVEIGVPSASPVVMLHGLLVGSVASWYFTSAPILAKEHAVLLYDLRGHGRSELAATGYDTETLAKDLEALLDVKGWRGPVALVGHSYGALVALRFALAHPARVSRLALVEAPLPPSSLPDLQTLLALDPSHLASKLPALGLRSLQRGGRQAAKFAASLSRLAFQTSLLADLQAESDIPDERLAMIKGALLVYGEDSACLGVGRRLESVMPDSTLQILPGGHYLHLDAPQSLSHNLQTYLRNEHGSERG